MKDKKEIKKEVKKSKNKFDFKKYIKDFLVFIRENLEKSFKILLIISIILIIIEIFFFLDVRIENIQIEKIKIFKYLFNNLKILYITVIAGIVPYIFAPVIGFMGFLTVDVADFANIIDVYGYIKGFLISIVPLILDTVAISIATALGIYICRRITVSYRITSIKNMNTLNFRIRFYQVIGKDKKAELYMNKKEEKIAKLENKKERINYIQIGNTLILIAILELIAVVIKRILM